MNYRLYVKVHYSLFKYSKPLKIKFYHTKYIHINNNFLNQTKQKNYSQLIYIDKQHSYYNQELKK